MSNVGYIIKLERKKQHMKQSALARGICSTSYLSKIENNRAEASEEVLYLLLNKLHLDYGLAISPTGDDVFMDELKTIYKAATLQKDNAYNEEKFQYLITKDGPFDDETFFFLNLVILRLALSLDEHDTIRVRLGFLGEEMANLTPFQLYLLKKNEGIYWETNKEKQKALISFEEALECMSGIVLEDWEKADLYYMLGVVYVLDGQILNTIDYSKKALDFFLNSLQLNRTINCYLLLGIAYKKGKRFEEAIQSYQLALKMSDQSHLAHQTGKIYHNMGALYSHINHQQAIHYYTKSLLYKVEANTRLVTVFEIIKEYTKKENWNKVRSYLSMGFNIINREPDSYQTYRYHFQVYKDICFNGYLSEKNGLSAINFFTDRKDYSSCFKYSTLLGHTFFKQGWYKSSALYYQHAQAYSLKAMKIKHLEDIEW